MIHELPMRDFAVQGAIFDVDDTLLDNKPGKPGLGLHEKARLAAAHEAGERYDIPALAELTVQDNLNAFLTAPVHTLEAAVWNILLMTGVADSEVMNREHPLLKEMIAHKNELYETILLEEGEEVPGASAFVRSLATHGLEGKLAIASTAIRRDIDIFLGKSGLTQVFPSTQIKSLESITHPKPHPEIFNAAFTSLHLPEDARSHVCAFEDDPRGIMSAKAAGLYTCAITTRYTRAALQGLEVPPDLIADTFPEFAEIFGVEM